MITTITDKNEKALDPNGILYTPVTYRGLIADIPAVAKNGEVFVAMDEGKKYRYNEETSLWVEVSEGGITPVGTKNITDTLLTDVSAYANAQVVDANLLAENIKKNVNILGILGSFEGGGGGTVQAKKGTYYQSSTKTLGRVEYATKEELGFIPDLAFVMRANDEYPKATTNNLLGGLWFRPRAIFADNEDYAIEIYRVGTSASRFNLNVDAKTGESAHNFGLSYNKTLGLIQNIRSATPMPQGNYDWIAVKWD